MPWVCAAVIELNEKRLVELERAYKAAIRLSGHDFASDSARKAGKAFAQKLAVEIADLKWPGNDTMAAD